MNGCVAAAYVADVVAAEAIPADIANPVASATGAANTLIDLMAIPYWYSLSAVGTAPLA